MTRPLVLIVEDNPDMQALLSDIFQLEKMDTLTTDYGEQALEMLRDRSPDVILLDFNLSGSLNGIEVLQAIRNDPDIAHMPVVLLTGQSLATRIPEAEDADLVIQKPINTDHLVRLVRRLLGK